MDEEFERIRIPPVTAALVALCIVLFIALDMSTDSERLLMLLGVYISPFAIWDGAYSTLLGASWVHFDFFHLAISCAGLWFFGSQIEFAFGSQVMFGISFFASILSMGVQMLAVGSPSVGATGVDFALFGVIAGASSAVPRFASFLNPVNRRIAIAALLLCLPLGFLGYMPMGNAAHLAGLVFGLAVAQIFVQHQYRLAAIVALLLLAVGSVTSLFWMPWNQTWFTWHVIRTTYGRATELAGWRTFIDPANPVGPKTLNDDAYQLAASPIDSERDGGQALNKARTACNVTMWSYPEYIDTLAAAFAENGQWKEAQATEQIAAAQLRAMLPSTFKGDKEALAAYTELLTSVNLHLRDILQKRKIRDPYYLTRAATEAATVKAAAAANSETSSGMMLLNNAPPAQPGQTTQTQSR